MQLNFCGKAFKKRRRSAYKIILAMKLTALFITIAFLQVSAKTVAQKITINEKDISLVKALQSIKKQSGYALFYDNTLISKADKTSINLKDASVEVALTEVLKKQPFTYTIIDKTIVIKPKEEPTVLDKIKSALNLDKIDVTGRVVGEDGQPLPGATVIVKETNISTSTDANGYFTLKDIDPNAILQISFIGYQKLELKASASLKTIKMAITQNKLDEVKVIAYGQTTERLSIGNSTTVTAKDIEKQPVSNPILALQGRVPGLFVQQQNGIPGSQITIRIQGQNSIQNGNDPFFVIDGVPFSSNLPGTGVSPINLINPSDIESISILKDADATSIYGSRAANGAIIITTKKGKAGDTRVDVNLQNGWGHITRELPLMNTQQYLQMRREAIKNDGLTIQPSEIDFNGTLDSTRSTDWQKELIGGNSHYSNLNANISGGSENTQFFVGTNYHRETTVFKGDFDDRKGDVHFNLGTSSSNKKFRFQLSGSYLFEDNHLPSVDITSWAYQLAPNDPALFNKDGSINWALDKNGNSVWDLLGPFGGYPLTGNYQPYEAHNSSLVGNALLSYKILQGLEVRSTFGYSALQANETNTSPESAVEPAQQPYYNRHATYNKTNGYTWIAEPQISYIKTLGDGKIDFLVGATFQQTGNNGTSIQGNGYSSDLLLTNPGSAATTTVNSANSEYKYNALFSRLNLNWDDRYIFELTARRDGSSRFGSKNEFHNFGAIGSGWIFSNESFIKNNLSFLSFGKLKGSYGLTGNDQIGEYGFLSLYNSNSVNIPYQGIGALRPNGLTNPYLEWEETRKLQIGLDLGFFNDRLLVNATRSINKSSNQLVNYSLPYITGFSFINKNLNATVQNSNWEFSLTSVNIKKTALSWTSRLNLTLARNKLLAFPDFANSAYASTYEIGQSLNIAKVFRFAGVNPQTGLYQFTDAKGNLTSNPQYNVDNTAIVDQTPKFFGGLENSITYKGFELSFLFQFVKQKGLNYAFGNFMPGSGVSGNQPLYVFNNRWQKPGDEASIQKFSSTFDYATQISDAKASDANYIDASYVRLKNLSFSYQLNSSWTKTLKIQTCKLFVQAQNLLTITSYKGLDPENPLGTNAQLPPLRIITVGLNATF